ncbi:hypothetical protein IWX49DRAFT_38340 [Phyllosticta citricarpa]
MMRTLIHRAPPAIALVLTILHGSMPGRLLFRACDGMGSNLVWMILSLRLAVLMDRDTSAKDFATCCQRPLRKRKKEEKNRKRLPSIDSATTELKLFAFICPFYVYPL